jgi:uncharacterized protein (TIGR02145 family)
MKSLLFFISGLIFSTNALLAQVAINTDGSAADNSAILDVKSVKQGLLLPRMTFSQRNSILNPVDGLVVYCTNCNSDGSGTLCLYQGGQWKTIDLECYVPNTPSEGNHTQTFTQITWNWNPVPIATGYKWSPNNDYATAIDLGLVTTKTETGLFPGDQCTRYVWAYNNCGHSAAVTLNDSTLCYLAGAGVTDVDGHVYSTIILGTQEWMGGSLWSNLTTAHYANGDPIPEVITNEQWSMLSTGAVCNLAYSPMYNWYAVSDPRHICPSGWHVPTDTEWTVLINYLGGNEHNAASKLLQVGYWSNCATDVSNFMGYPSGFRSENGSYSGENQMGAWWSSTANGSDLSFCQLLHYYFEAFGYCTEHNWNFPPRCGLSVRCLKD